MAAGSGDRGGMLAVQAPLAEVEKAVKEEKLDLIIANKNTPAQFVLSGATPGIKRAAERLPARGLKCTVLQVSAAFHSPLVAGAQKEFAAALSKVKFNKPQARVYANKTAAAYPEAADKARETLASQLASPVEFTALIEKMYADGIRIFVEAGPGARLTGMVSAILSGKEHSAFAIDASSGKKHGVAELGRVLARLAALGCAVDLTAWEGGEAGARDALEKKVSKLAVKVTGAGYRSPRKPSTAPKRWLGAPQAPAPSAAYAQSAASFTAAPGANVSEAMRVTQESMAALQRLQEQTALIHARFLEGQEAAQRSFQALIDQQRALLGGASAGDTMRHGVPVPLAQPFAAPVFTAPAPLPAVQDAATLAAPGAPALPAGPDVSRVLLEIVSGQTGYPVESLNPDMDMESDLGIDSIKRVAILSELQEKLPQAPRITPEQLGTIRTLRQVAAHLNAGAAPAPVVTSKTPAASPPAMETELTREVLRLADLDPAARGAKLDLDKSLPLWVADDGSKLANAVVKDLAGRGYKAEKVPLEGRAVPTALAALIVLAPAAKLGRKDFWPASSEEFLKKTFRLVRAAGPALRAAGKKGGACLLTVSRLDGAFGLAGLKAEQDPVFGGLAGLAKTAGHEWPEVACRALDAASGWDHTVSVARAVADELFYKGPVELGLSETGGKVVLLSASERSAPGKFPLAKGDVVLITGGARGVTAEAAAALARSCGASLALVGRSPLPAAEEPWLAACASEADIKKALISRNPGMPPKEAGERCAKLLYAREIRAQLNRFEAAGSRAAYYSADIRDAAAVRETVARIKKELGPVRGLVHGAGVLADKLILDKTDAQFDPVFDTKVAGLRALLTALDLSALKAVALYSSSTARFGRTGQCDYAMANEVLNKTARLLARRLPGCRVASFNWGPWDGGMVNDGLKALFAKEGVGVIGLEEGGKFLADEL
ncbi:MAG TPA: SDR family NAD(P)-dependent oxidoreductase, partial [Elusimicrobiales bacterium]|nr:SDR family NAD(P)-dependent oxidoreductase [Elusimicrobiales bacterium]